MLLPLRDHDPESLKLQAPIPLTIHPAVVYLSSLGQGSRSTMTQSLNAIAHLLTNGNCDHLILDWTKLRYRHTVAVRTVLLTRHAPATANKMLCALRRVLTEALRLELMDATDYAKAVDLPSIKDTRKLRGRALSSEEIEALMGVCEASEGTTGVRDLALIALLRGCGLRRSEVVNLELRDYHPSQGALDIRNGKGGKDRTVYLPESAIVYIEDWLSLRGNRPGALLCPIRKGGAIQYRHMVADAVLKIMQKRAKQAGVQSFSPHDFRRTFCSDLLDAGVDIVTVQKLAGHASPVTTAKYDRRGEETKRNAVQKLRLRQE
jgi:integrase/recombinase XerD